MPINFTPRERQIIQPRSGVLRDAWGAAYKAYSRNPSLLLERFGEFEEGQSVKVERGRVEVNANNILEQAVKQPAYAIETPLRPLNVATGGGVGEALETVWNVGKSIPVLGIGLSAIEATGNILDASSRAGRGFMNFTLAEHLKNTVGKPDSFVSNVLGESLTAKEIRERVMSRWGVNPYTGEEMSLRQLEARALKNTMDFGEFNVHENGLMNFGVTALADPLNLVLLGGPTAVRAGVGAIRGASWALPAVNLGTRLVTAPRLGYGALKSLGRVAIETPRGARFVDEYTAARAAVSGQLASHSTLAGSLRAASWIMRGLYLPGRAGMIERGIKPTQATVTAYMRGGLQQGAAFAAGEQLAGMANGWVVGQGLGGTVADGFTGWLHDTLNKINNDHPLSDHDAFVTVALFSPWASALGDIPRSIKARATKSGLPRYADNTLFHVKNEFRRMFNQNETFDSILTKMGRGDAAEGRRAWEWFTDQMEVFKAENQLTNFTRGTAEIIEDAAQRAAFLTETVVGKVKVLREKGALQPKSLADYMIDFYRTGGRRVEGDEIAHAVEITADNFYKFVNDLYRVNRDLGGQAQKLGNLTFEQGAPITREIFDGILDTMDSLPDDTIIPRDIAATIIDSGPSLVWDSEFFRRFSATLGQVQSASGKIGRKNTMAEGVTVGDLRERLAAMRESAPEARELFHESVAATRRATKIKPGETLLAEPPYKMPKKLEARRVYNTGRVKQLAATERVLTNMRNMEFFRNGKPKLQSAKELVGPDGGLFKAEATHTGERIMRRESDGATFSVHDGVLDASVLDSETIVLGVQNGGRITLRPVSDGPTLAAHGFVEVARVKGSDLASYAYRGGDVTKIIENQRAGTFRPYKPAKKEAGQPGAINAARRSANDASLLYPSMEALFPSVTKSSRHANPAERLKAINELIEASRVQRQYLMRQISRSDDVAMRLLGIDPKLTSKLGDWFDHASKGEIDRVMGLMKSVNRDYPNLSLRESQGVFIDPTADRFSTLVGYRNTFRRLAFEYGHLSPLNYLYTSLFAYQNARHLGKQAQTEIHNLLAQSGFTADESRKFVTLLRDEVVHSRSVPGSLGSFSGSHLYRSIRALPESKVRELMEQVAPGKTAEVLERWGHVQKMLTEAGNRMVRNVNQRARSGGKVDPLLSAVNSAFRIWQYAPGLESVSSSTHFMTKFLYPLFRFFGDPFYHAMNAIEPDMYALTMEGARSTRWGRGVGIDRTQSANAAELASLTSIPPGGLTSQNLPADLLLADAGAYTMPRNIRPTIERHFDIKRLSSTEDVFRALKDEDPVAVIMREHFGDDLKDWAKAADEMLYGYVTKGPEQTVREAWKEALDQIGIDANEAKTLAPFVERLASAHRGNYNDLVQLYIGRLNRPNIERILDNFFLFWPLSYQVKATMWLARIMFQRIGGVNTGAAGAYLWNEYRQRWNATLESDAETRNWFEDHDMATTMFEMLFPMTPEGIGVSLSRPVKYVGSWLADGLEIDPEVKQAAFGDYPYVRTIPELLSNSLQVGPMRTARFVSTFMRQFEVPGFTYEDNEVPDNFDPEDYIISNLAGT